MAEEQILIDAGPDVVAVAADTVQIGVVDGLGGRQGDPGPPGPQGPQGPPGPSGVTTVNRVPGQDGNAQVSVEISREVFSLIENPDPNIMYFVNR